MFTKRTLLGLKAFFQLQHWVRSGPYVWDDESNSAVQISASKINWLLFCVSSLWFTVRTAYYPANLIRKMITGISAAEFVLGFCIAFWMLTVGLYQVNMILHLDEIRGFINSMLRFNRSTAVVLTGKEHPVKKDGCSKFIWMMVVSSVMNPLMDVLTVYGRNPMEERFLYHCFTTKREQTLMFYVYGVLEYYGQLLAWHPWLFIFFFIWTYTKSTSFWLKQMRYGVNAKLTERPKDVVKLYQELQVLNRQFNACFAGIGVPTFVLQNVAIHTMALYITLKLHGRYPVSVEGAFAFWSVFWFWLEGILYTLLGNVNYYSKIFVKSWTDVLGVKSRKKLKSMPPLGVKVGDIYVIHRTTVLSIYLLVVNATVQALLLH